MTTDGPEVAAAKWLLDLAKDGGFVFERNRTGRCEACGRPVDWRDELYLAGFFDPDSCTATRRRRSSLVVPGGLPVTEELRGDALTVLCDWSTV